ncbi:acyltransferase family protein [Euzebyella saccharophila]|uniref:Acyltransferase family protein n=1 Tax=Euzebyella saccharophila TaxID=679664 RepID=A0ABV8JSM2_9FLAO|nr:acyltransferase family protein [Euzebyella saccharophila]
MQNKKNRLYFIDAIRAWAILMMLQGHFVDGLLSIDFRDDSNVVYSIWKYFRGITAPVFFTVSGFIFTYLLIKSDQKGIQNPRVKKGIKRGLELLFLGYLLRTNFMGLLQGQIYSSFYLVDVLHCIGLSLLGIIGIYLLTIKRKPYVLGTVLTVITLLLFLFEPLYKQFGFSLLPDAIANYFTKANGSVFTIIPWFGYASIGAALSLVFTRFKSATYFYQIAIPCFAIVGWTLISYSSPLFLTISEITGITLFADVYYNNYLFIRLGDVFLVLALFMLMRRWMQNSTILKIGQSTLSIYVIHFIVLYGSFTGLGLYRFFHHELNPIIVIPGAVAFMFICTYSALQYEKNKAEIQLQIVKGFQFAFNQIEIGSKSLYESAKPRFKRFLRRFGLAKSR